jgi:hypothetical protein
LDQVKKENEGKDVISFEDFVEGLNTGDNFTKRVFEILIRVSTYLPTALASSYT